ncbi:hypothetical protein NL676_001278 [Syzygium grande]|nr:hypothetical protein NL676_001278 [Syzygium grande]
MGSFTRCTDLRKQGSSTTSRTGTVAAARSRLWRGCRGGGLVEVHPCSSLHEWSFELVSDEGLVAKPVDKSDTLLGPTQGGIQLNPAPGQLLQIRPPRRPVAVSANAPAGRIAGAGRSII